MSLPRPHFYHRQPLTSADLNAAQLYHIDAGRRHRAGAHLPGVIDGLVIDTEDEDLLLLQGYAVDGFGRDLVLDEPVRLRPRLDAALISEPDADTFEVLLNYSQRLAPNTNGEDDPSRLDERPHLELRALNGPAEELPALPLVEPAPDDPNMRSPVRLGLLRADANAPNGWVFVDDSAVRQEAGLVAARVAPANDDDGSRLELARGRFAVLIPPAKKDDLSERLVVDAGGATFHGALALDGPAEVASELAFTAPGPAPAENSCGLYRIGSHSDAPDTHELRLVLPREGRLAIGAWSDQAGAFEAVLTIDAAARSVTINGDLIVEGALVEPMGRQELDDAGDAGGGGSREDETMGATVWSTTVGWLANTGGSAMRLLLLFAVIFGFMWFEADAKLLGCARANQIRALVNMERVDCPNGVEMGEDCPTVVENNLKELQLKHSGFYGKDIYIYAECNARKQGG